MGGPGSGRRPSGHSKVSFNSAGVPKIVPAKPTIYRVHDILSPKHSANKMMVKPRTLRMHN
jgi:hypothetical protein